MASPVPVAVAGKIIALDDHRPRIIIECENGDRYCYTELELQRVAQGKLPLAHIHPQALGSIVGQWLYLVDLIDEFNEGEA